MCYQVHISQSRYITCKKEWREKNKKNKDEIYAQDKGFTEDKKRIHRGQRGITKKKDSPKYKKKDPPRTKIFTEDKDSLKIQKKKDSPRTKMKYLSSRFPFCIEKCPFFIGDPFSALSLSYLFLFSGDPLFLFPNYSFLLEFFITAEKIRSTKFISIPFTQNGCKIQPK